MLELLPSFAQGGSFFHWLLAVSLTLLILDTVVCTELLSWVALVLFALYGTWLAELPIQWSVLVFLACLAVEVVLYYTFWSQVVRPLVMKVMLRGAPDDIQENPVGRTGIAIQGDDGSFCVKVADLLYPVSPDDYHLLADGSRVQVTALTGGIARVCKLS